MQSSHDFFMQKCIALAYIAKQRGESPVGSIIVHDNNIIGEGIEAVKAHNDITFHAEIEAVRQAVKFLNSRNLSGCTLYTTHEPCIMCSYVIRQSKISTVVMGMLTGDIGGYGSNYPLLRDTNISVWGNPPEIVLGVLEEECRELKK